MAVDIAALEAQAATIPEMGGRRIGEYLRQMARDARRDSAIVELGCWLGAGTAQMALGLLDRPADHGVSIHCYDTFQLSEESALKAQRQGVPLGKGDDMLPWVTGALAPFGGDIHLHKGFIGDETVWSGEKISLHVDDATKYPHTFYKTLKIFGPSWVPGETVVVLMDFWLFRKPHNAHRVDYMRAQHDFVVARPEIFEPTDLEDGTCAAFRYVREMDFSALAIPELPKKPPKRRPITPARVVKWLKKRVPFRPRTGTQ